ncbi:MULTISPECIES: hypothetical protein [Pseudofrankia]|uniref:hypothetical protein n=1 Tax=Pseudofrankia TaxID=2994363 RepID=UPI000234B2D5|nr:MULTISPECIES: hypothetical protein [Pseudofrankia]
MRNHGEKTKDMAESVLPSTARRSARQERRRIHQRQRARERNLMVVVRGSAEHDDGDADFREVFRRRDISQMVWDRRGADKTGSLVRWAGSRVDRDDSLREASVDEQIQYFARLLPDNLIGRHAVQHIEFALEYRARPGYWRSYRAEQDARRRREHDQLATDLRAVLETGRHRELNEALRAGYLRQAGVRPCGAQPTVPVGAVGRLLLGAHDVDDFVNTVAGRHPWILDIARGLARKAG